MTSVLREERSLNALFSGLPGIICSSILIRLMSSCALILIFCNLDFEKWRPRRFDGAGLMVEDGQTFYLTFLQERSKSFGSFFGLALGGVTFN